MFPTSRIYFLYVLIFTACSYSQVLTIVSDPPVQNSYFGYASATDGQTLVVGSPYENNSLGAAYVYTKNGLDWDYVAKLEPNYADITQTSPLFGYSVDVDGDTIAVGAYRYDSVSLSNIGAVFIYERDLNNNWNVEPSLLTVGDLTEGINFGTSLAIDGDALAVGATFDDDEKGAVYVYERSGGNWSFDQKLTASDGQGKGGSRSWGDWLGFSVAIDGDIIVAGARQDKIDSNERQGSAYVFTKSGDDWAGSVSKLYNSSGAAVDYYGCSVDVSGEVVVVGAYGESKGKVYVYRYNGGQWSLEQQLPQEPQYSSLYTDPSQDFGYDVAIDGDRIVTGAPRLAGGYAFMFEWDGSLWSEAIELVPSGGEGYLGRSVAISGDIVFAGAPYKDGQLQDIGAVYAIILPKKVFNEFQVNTYTNADQKYPSIATDPNGNFIAAWDSEGQDSGSYGIYGQRFDPYGRRIENEFQVNVSTVGTQSRANVAINASGDFVVAWNGMDGSSEGIYARRYASNGTPLSGEFMVNTYTDNRQLYPTAALNDNGTSIVTWKSFHGDNDWRVAGRLYDAAGNPLTTEFDINQSGSCGKISLAVSDTGDFTVVWTRALLGYNICARQYNGDGTPKDDEMVLLIPAEDSGALGPKMVTDGSGNYVLAWHYATEWLFYEHRDIYGQRYDSNLNPVGQQFMVNTNTTGTQQYPDIAMNSNGQFVIAWYGDTDGSEDGVFVQKYNSNAQPIGGESQLNTYINGGQKRPVVVMQESGRFVAAWHSESQDGSDYGIIAAIGPATYLGDFDFSGQVDIADLALLAQRWLSDEPVLDIAPEDGDGTVNLLDFSVLAEQWQ